MTRKVSVILLFVFCLSGGHALFGQSHISLYQMQNSVPQANFLNPAFSPKSKIILGLPAISSNYFSFESPLAIRDALAPGTGDALRIDTDAVLESLKNNNRFNIDGNLSWLFFGYNTKKGFLTVSVNTRINTGFAFPGSVMELLINGPGAEDAQAVELNDFDFKASAFHEFAVGYNRSINDKLVVGGRLKYLRGILNMNLNELNGRIITNIDSVHLSVNPWSIQSSGLDSLDNPGMDFLLGTNNTGFGLDLGAQYALTDNIRISASILDLGSITWRENVKSFEFGSVEYTFDGFDFLEIVKDDNTLGPSILDKELDSLELSFDPLEVEGGSYKSALTGRFYLGGTYTLMDMHTFGAVFYGEVFKSRMFPAMSLTYNIALGKVLDVGVSAGYRNKRLGNFGAGLSVKGGPIQLYLLGENIESMFYPSRARVVGVRFGLVLALGKADSQF